MAHIERRTEPFHFPRHWIAPRRWTGHEGRDVLRPARVRLRKPSADFDAFLLDRGAVHKREKRDHDEQQRPVRRNGEAGGNEKASEVQRVACVRTGRSSRGDRSSQCGRPPTPGWPSPRGRATRQRLTSKATAAGRTRDTTLPRGTPAAGGAV